MKSRKPSRKDLQCQVDSLNELVEHLKENDCDESWRRMKRERDEARKLVVTLRDALYCCDETLFQAIDAMQTLCDALQNQKSKEIVLPVSMQLIEELKERNTREYAQRRFAFNLWRDL